MFARLPFDEQAWLAEAGHSRAAAGEAGFSTLERIWARPTAEVNGMWGGHTGAGRQDDHPGRRRTRRCRSGWSRTRSPPTSSPGLREYVAQHTPPGIEATVTARGPGVRASFSPVDSPAVLAARRAMQRAFSTEVFFTREGGSGPEADLAVILGAPLVFLAVGLDSDRIHAPNEKVEMGLLLKGAEAAAYLWDELAAAGQPAAAPVSAGAASQWRPSRRRRSELGGPGQQAERSGVERQRPAAQPRAGPLGGGQVHGAPRRRRVAGGGLGGPRYPGAGGAGRAGPGPVHRRGRAGGTGVRAAGRGTAPASGACSAWPPTASSTSPWSGRSRTRRARPERPTAGAASTAGEAWPGRRRDQPAAGRAAAVGPRRRADDPRGGAGQLARGARALPAVRRGDRADPGRPRAALRGRRQRALPAARPRGDHAGDRPRRPVPAGQERAVARAPGVDPGRVRGAGRVGRAGGGARGARGDRDHVAGEPATWAASPGRCRTA